MKTARAQGGFTLVELLVVMMAGMVVLSALFTILDVTLRNTSRTFTKVDATGRARTTLERLENELHSACLTTGITPVGGGANNTKDSDDNNLVFISQYGTSASPTPVEHRIAFNSVAGTLTEYTYSLSSGTTPSNWVFSSTATPSTGTTLLNNVAQATIPSTTTKIPVFQYFAYEPYTDTNGNSDMMIMDGTSAVPGTTSVSNPDPLSTSSGLSQTDAQNTAEVMINLTVGAAGGSGENTNYSDTADTVTDSVLLRLTPAPNQSGTTSSFGPCV